MYSFLLCAGLPEGTERSSLERALELVLGETDQQGRRVDSSIVCLPEIRGGWFTVVTPRCEPLIQTWTGPELSVLFFGDVVGIRPPAVAEHVARSWTAGGAVRVQELNGSFSAVIVDRRTAEVHVISDSLGCRTCRYVSKGVFRVSPQDLPLVSLGGVDPSLDLTSAAAILACDWSLGGHSLLRDVQTCDPRECVTWHDGRVEKRATAPLIGEHRCRSLDGEDGRTARTRMIATLQDSIRHVTDGTGQVSVDLTAGLDSRALTAFVTSVCDRSRIQTVTAGGPDSYDVRVARRIAGKLGVRHVIAPLEDPSLGGFLADARMLAFHMNGDTSAKRAFVSPPADPERQRTTQLSGCGGEIYRGYYYPAVTDESLARLDPAAVTRWLRGKMTRLTKLPWSESERPQAVGRRLDGIVEGLFDVSGHPADVLDLFYVYERVGRWGSIRERHPALGDFDSPFTRPALVRAAFRLPPASGARFCFHADLIRSSGPWLRHWLINGTWILPGSREARLGRLVRRARQRIARNVDKLRRVTARSGEPAGGLDHMESDLFAGQLFGAVRDLLLAADGVGSKLFDAQALEALLDQHRRGVVDHGEVIGLLVTMQLWWHAIQRVASRAP